MRLIVNSDAGQVKARLDQYGVSVSVLLLLWLAQPDALVQILKLLVGSTEFMSLLLVRGQAYGKESSVTPAFKVRVVLPLPALMQVVEAPLLVLLK